MSGKRMAVLVEHFAQKYARPGESPKRFSGEAMEALWKYPWPGTVRELESP